MRLCVSVHYAALLILIPMMLYGCDQITSILADRPSSTYEIDRSRVPHNLHHLIPYAEQWGISDQQERSEYLNAASVEDLHKLIEYINEYRDAIYTFLNRFSDDEMTDEALAFMYLIITIDDADESLK